MTIRQRLAAWYAAYVAEQERHRDARHRLAAELRAIRADCPHGHQVRREGAWECQACGDKR